MCVCVFVKEWEKGSRERERERECDIYIYIYISVATLAYFCYSCPPSSVNFSSQPVVRGPKVSHHSCYCVILHCIAQIDKRTLHGVFL